MVMRAKIGIEIEERKGSNGILSYHIISCAERVCIFIEEGGDERVDGCSDVEILGWEEWWEEEFLRMFGGFFSTRRRRRRRCPLGEDWACVLDNFTRGTYGGFLRLGYILRYVSGHIDAADSALSDIQTCTRMMEHYNEDLLGQRVTDVP